MATEQGAAAAPGAAREKPAAISLKQTAQRFKGVFTAELKEMLWTHGDPGVSDPATVELLEDILLEFMINTCVSAHQSARHRTRLKLDDLRHVFRHDPIMLGRMEEILKKDEAVRRARSLADQGLANLAAFAEDTGEAEDGGPSAGGDTQVLKDHDEDEDDQAPAASSRPAKQKPASRPSALGTWTQETAAEKALDALLNP